MQEPIQARDRTDALFAAFDPFISRGAPALQRVLLAAFEFAPVEATDYVPVPAPPSGAPSAIVPAGWEIVIDKTAFLLGAIADGLNARGRPSTSAWLVEWLRAEAAEPTRFLDLSPRTEESPQAAFDRGVAVVASRSFRGSVLPAARDLAGRTVGRDRADLRHVLFALLEEPYPAAGRLGEFLTAERLLRLKALLVERIIATPEKGEKVESWRALLTQEPAERVRTLADAPALIDSLGRRAFADVLATRIKQVGASLRADKHNKDSAFILHMDGPWGSGKSSILNFLKEDLEASEPPWLVVEFNAWRSQHRKPSWWPLISQVGAAARGLKWYSSPRARWVWAWWNLRMRWVPVVLTGMMILAFLYFAWSAVSGSTAGQSGLPKAIQDAVNGLLALVALGGLAWTTSRSLFFGSTNAAEAYVQSNSEPFRPIIDLFERLVAAIDRPVAIFIDDLDRCESAHVIDLLEGIQTLLRSAPVVYVVAGDRKWICSSFEKRYADFCGEIGAPGRPLGYLFLDKVFQLSTAIPQLSARRQAQYWRQLLDLGQSGAEGDAGERERLERDAAHEMQGKTRHEEIQRQIERSEEGSLKRETLRAAAARQITSPEAIRAAEHRLQPLAHLLEANPRSMKRLVNAYGLNHARAFLEGRDVTVEALARWTIIELRWPLLADHLARNWPEIADGTLAPGAFPEPIRDLLMDGDVRAVIGRDGDKGWLTVETLGPILS